VAALKMRCPLRKGAGSAALDAGLEMTDGDRPRRTRRRQTAGPFAWMGSSSWRKGGYFRMSLDTHSLVVCDILSDVVISAHRCSFLLSPFSAFIFA
jgi:hypothetical protein